MVIDDRAQVVNSMKGADWDSFELSDTRVRGDNDYDALLNSTYIREDGAWRLALHQQTPV